MSTKVDIGLLLGLGGLPGSIGAAQARACNDAVAEIDSLRQQLVERDKRIDRLRRAANWFASHNPGEPVPDWIDEAMSGEWLENDRARGHVRPSRRPYPNS